MIKMRNRNITLHGTQTIGLGVMISRCPPIASLGDLRMLSVIFSDTRTTTKVTTQTRGSNTENGFGKTTDFHLNAILGATLHREGIGKE